MKTSRPLLAALLAGSAVLLTAGSVAATTPATTPATTAGTAATTAGTAATPTTDAPPSDADKAAALERLDSNKDGKVAIGVATAGPADDGGYYQALVDKTKAVSTAWGFAEPIVVDEVTPEDANTQLDNLAQQSVDVILVGAGEIAQPLPELTEKYKDIFWYCNCGAGQAPLPGLAQSQDDSSEISYTAGYATGLLLKAKGATSSVFIGCCDQGFEKEAYMAFEFGLQAVDPAFTMKYVASGDFNDTAGATEALNAAVADGAQAVYPFLGGAHEPVVKLANDKGLIVMSAGSSKVCARTDLKYDIAVRFDSGDYLSTIFSEIIAGTFKEGDARVFRVGADPEPGAVICQPTAEQTAAMDAVYAQIAKGDLAAKFGEIKGKAYAGG